MKDLLFGIGFAAIWVILQVWVFPRLGVPT